MNEEVFEEIRQDCPLIELQSHWHCTTTTSWIKCCQKNCAVVYWIEAISKRVLNSGYEVKDFMNDPSRNG